METAPAWALPELGSPYELVTTPAHLQQMLEVLSHQPLIGLDTEATDKTPRTAIPLLLQLGYETEDGPRAFVVVLPAFQPHHLAPLWRLLESGRHLLIGHNLSYDCKLLAHWYGCQPPRLYDTLLAEAMLTAGDFDRKDQWLTNLSLAAVHYRYFGTEMAKEERQTFLAVVPSAQWRPSPSQTEYAARDVLCLPKLYRLQVARLKDEGLVRSARYRMLALPEVCAMELRGMAIDPTPWRAWLATQQTIKAEAEVTLQTLLTPYEWQYQKTQREAENLAFVEWEVAYGEFLDELRAVWESGGFRDAPWGEYKKRHVALWREAHPRPPKPRNLEEGFVISLRSTQQVHRAFEALGFENLESTDKETRAKLLRRPDLTPTQRTVLETYDRYNKAAHNVSSFGENILARLVNGRLAGMFNIGLTETGRMSSEKPNFQNFPADPLLRSSFVADPDCVVITADFKSQELAIVAALSQDQQMIADLNAGKDLYKALATQVYHVALEAVTDKQRKMCKSALLGINYGLSVKGLEKNHQIPPAEGEKIIAAIRGLYPDMVAWSDAQVQQALTDRYVTTAAGSRRYFRDRMMPTWKVATEARNAPVQGTAADIVYRVIARLHTALPRYGAYLGNVVHDEAVVVCPLTASEVVRHLVIDEMQAAFYDILPRLDYGVGAGVDVKVGPHWMKG